MGHLFFAFHLTGSWHGLHRNPEFTFRDPTVNKTVPHRTHSRCNFTKDIHKVDIAGNISMLPLKGAV